MSLQQNSRLHFIDVIRAFAILMMLQGHFIDGLMDPIYGDKENIGYLLWKYFRGITAPTFFTVAGFIFMYLLLQQQSPTVWKNPRVYKGIKRGLVLIGIGYLLRLNLLGLIHGELYESFYRVDVLHCIGLSILCLTGIYILNYKTHRIVLASLLLLSGITIFLFEPLYSQANFDFLPEILANFFTKINGSVFTILPWLGYVTFGAFAATCFQYFKAHRHIYKIAIGMSLGIGVVLIYFSSSFFWSIYNLSGITLTKLIVQNNYLFIRLGNVLVIFAIFMLMRHILVQKIVQDIGKQTLSIYVIHFIILYGGITGFGLYEFFSASLPPYIVIPSALLFMGICIYLSLLYNRIKPLLASKVTSIYKPKDMGNSSRRQCKNNIDTQTH